MRADQGKFQFLRENSNFLTGQIWPVVEQEAGWGGDGLCRMKILGQIEASSEKLMVGCCQINSKRESKNQPIFAIN